MSTQTRWQFTPDEFAYVWDAETGSDDTPYPISVAQTPTTSTEYARLRAEISTRYPRHGDPDLTGPLRALANPEVRIVVWGKFHQSNLRIRTLAAAVGNHGIVLCQKPTESADFGGDVILIVTQRAQLGRNVAATLPPAEAGKVKQLIGYTPRVRGELPPSTWLPDNRGRKPVEERIRALLRAPRTAEGFLRIERRISREPQYVSWFDVDPERRAAGRYLVSVENDEATIAPASFEVIAQHIHRNVMP
ncbi:ESX secretion-associated protein EspG [Nocardia macrotermitis]|uniref:ESX secretion-associated protein EspG n=1 Tax=Nocardia macrotermitis TaxID=2585198 RepID=A0A7K0CXN1_9NOCA|nr:ESX secretion-associated protein EspG [Nocardia macrotermitis]MQY18191.1 hypothetical protein [Nocardia macrotermitis]